MTIIINDLVLDALAADAFDAEPVGRCRVCGCTDADCSGCIERTGSPCFWVEEDLCSACCEEGVPS